MSDLKKIICVIPARLNSQRLPEKILRDLAGKSLLQRVWQAANAARWFDEVIIALDDKKTEEHVKTFTQSYIMTSPSLPSGTHRLIATMQQTKKEADIWVNWQADEPFISSKMITDLLYTHLSDNADIWTLKTPIFEVEPIHDPNCVKVLCNRSDYALYFSRGTIPYARGITEMPTYYKHIGLYAYSQKFLEQFNTLPESEAAYTERLEQLSFLHHEFSVRVNTTLEQAHGIDTLKDFNEAEKALLEQS